MNCITCHDGLDICIITVSNEGQREFPALLLKDASVRVSLSSFFERLKMGTSCINACNSSMVKGTQSNRVLTACGKSRRHHLSVPMLHAAQAEAIAPFLGRDKQEASAVKRLMLVTVILLQAMERDTVNRRVK